MSLHQISESEKARAKETRARLARLGTVKIAELVKLRRPSLHCMKDVDGPVEEGKSPPIIEAIPIQITHDEIRECMERLFDSMDVMGVSINGNGLVDRAMDLVCRRYSVSRAAIIGPRRDAKIIWIRHLAMWLARHSSGQSSVVVARLFGDRDHTTVLNSLKRVEDRMGGDPEFKAEVHRLLFALRPVSPKEQTNANPDSRSI